MQNKSNSESRATTIDGIINEIESKSADGDYIYRGESKKHPEISSSLYREYAKNIDVEEFDLFDLMYAEKEMLKVARDHIGESPVGPLEDFIDIVNMSKRRMDYGEPSMRTSSQENTAETIGWTIAETADREILTELQHYGGKTNLIDFTTDYFIAVYFACSGHSEKVGRVILLAKNEDVENMIVRPRNPRHRVIAQKSVFLQPPQGYIEVPEDDIISIPVDLKQPLLDYLRKFHDISTESIYNDIHGFIRYHNIHQNAYVQFYTGLTFQKSGDETTSLKEEQAEYAGKSLKEQAKYKKAIEHYDQAINLNPDIGNAYYNRGWCRIYLEEWKKAAEDIEVAQDMGVDVVGIFRGVYKNVADFEQKTGIQLPSNIFRMLGEKERPSTLVDPSKRKRRPPKRLRVTMEGGKVIERESQRKTFIEAIEIAGIDKVHALELGTEMHPLVERKNTNDSPGKNRRSDTSGFYSIYGAYPAEDKEEHLRTISEKLGLQWDVEVIDR